ncbi:hypothetical protein Tco_0065820 [Tanacetum coccineum]
MQVSRRHLLRHYMVESVHRMFAGVSRQKSYADVRRKPLEFKVEDRVMLKFSPWKGVIHFGKRGGLLVGIHGLSLLIPMSRGSFEVIVGIDWLSKRKFVIVCYEKVVRIPLEVGDALCRNERVKSRRVRGMILAAQSEAFKQENVLLVGSVMDEAHASRYLHSQADGQSERMIQNLEDIMRACVVDFGGGYQLSIRCAPFEALYVRKCRSPVLWAEIRGSSLIGPELVQETTDKVALVKKKPKVARDRQQRYVDYRRKPLEFEVGDLVLLKVKPWKGVVRFRKKGKLAPRYVGPFEILERIGLVAYRLRLPEELSSVHDTFHVSNLKKCMADANLHVPLDEIKVDNTVRFVEEPVEIMDREIKKLKHKKIALVKVSWNSKRGLEFT